jgi:hypothetical protein
MTILSASYFSEYRKERRAVEQRHLKEERGTDAPRSKINRKKCLDAALRRARTAG